MGPVKPSVRSADVAGILKKLPVRKYSTSLKSIEISGESIPDDFALKLGNGISVLAGGNGAGKSSLLRAVRACLDADVDLVGENLGWFSQVEEINVRWARETGQKSSSVSTLRIERIDISSTEVTRTGARPESVHFIDAAAETSTILSMLQTDPNHRDLIEGIDPAPADAAGLMYASYILGRSYDAINVYEITANSEDDLAVPFFEVSALGVQYSALDMGRGELAALYLLWRLDQIPDGSVAILEEPETHLAVLSQKKLTEVIATISVQRDIAIILSTHSPGVFETLPPGHVALVGSLPRLSVSSDLDSRALASRLGLRRQARRLAITEDLFAAQLLEMLILQFDRSLMESVSVGYSKDGESGVLTILNGLKSYTYTGTGSSPVDVVGILDGDQRSVDFDHPVLFLPGFAAPELVVRERMTNWLRGSETFSGFGEPLATKLMDALIAAQGLDHHDWLVAVCAEFGGGPAFLDQVAAFLLQDPDFTAHANEMLEILNKT